MSSGGVSLSLIGTWAINQPIVQLGYLEVTVREKVRIG
jgi:hypothetical protein